MTKLSVNVNKIATLRNSRGKDLPNLVKLSLDLIRFGAEGITVHPRPDERHIKKSDVYELKKAINVEFNIEGYPSEDFISMVQEICPEQTTLVPDPPHVLTSNAGWVLKGNEKILKTALEKLKSCGTRVSLFVDPMTVAIEDLKVFRELGADRIELYTELYADSFGSSREDEALKEYIQCAEDALQVGLGINAGHDLNLLNLSKFAQGIPQLAEVSIGHALICDALYMGYETAIRKYRECLA